MDNQNNNGQSNQNYNQGYNGQPNQNYNQGYNGQPNHVRFTCGSGCII